jgi:cephalosporin hydroxylase
MSRPETFLAIDLEAGQVELDHGRATHRLDTPEAFAAISRAWLRAGWDTKYVYSFTWLGRPIIQLPEDMVRLQEVIYSVRPDVIVETGVAHGGSLVFSAGLCKLMDHGRAVGIDVEIRAHNRRAIEAHPLSSLITLFEGDSTSPEIVRAVSEDVVGAGTILVLLDSNHTRDHVLAELRAYAPLVTPGSYVVAMDGIIEDLAGAPRTREEWAWDNPRQAVREFLAENDRFDLDEPAPPFNEGVVTDRVTYWPGAFLRRRGA